VLCISVFVNVNEIKLNVYVSEMTTLAVIQTLLDKFLITDSCQKFALYEKINIEQPNTPGLSAIFTGTLLSRPSSNKIFVIKPYKLGYITAAQYSHIVPSPSSQFVATKPHLLYLREFDVQPLMLNNCSS